METSHGAAPGRPYDPQSYDRPGRYEMTGGSGFPDPEPNPSQPWQSSSNSRPVSDSGAWPPPPEAGFPRPAQDNHPAPYGPSPYAGPHDGTANVGYPNPAVEQMPGPAGLPPFQHGEPVNQPITPHVQPGLSAPMAMTSQDIKSVKLNCYGSLEEYLLLQKKRQSLGPTAAPDLDDRMRRSATRALVDLQTLREEVSILIKDAQGSRWRKWLIGGAVAALFPVLGRLIPAVRSLFRRSSTEKSEDKTVNDTEHAFARSKEILSRVKDSVFGKGGFASMTFLVFGVLYIFSNEVSIIVAKTMSKRLKKLTAKIERGGDQLTESDLKVLEGWRWRVLLWS